MNREEQILSEVKKHYYDDINCHNAFLHGVEWADEHPVDVWHEASEKPRTNEWILMQIGGGDYEAVSLNKHWVNIWFKSCRNIYKVSRWAYISDLLPKGGEE